MSKNLTFGQYYPTRSILHRIDPRVKLTATVLFLIELFIFDHVFGYILATLFIFSMIKISNIPIIHFLKHSKFLLFIIIFASCFNVFLFDGRVLVHLGRFHITDTGIKIAVLIAIRLFYIVLSSSVLMFTTTPNDLTDGMEKMLKPLKKIKVPVHDLAMITSIMLRFIPVLMEEANKIIKAQKARGVNLEGKNLIKRIRSYLPMFIPLFVSAFRRSNDLAAAMEARCYQGNKNRTKMKPLKYKKIDLIGYGILIVYFSLLLATSIWF